MKGFVLLRAIYTLIIFQSVILNVRKTDIFLEILIYNTNRLKYLKTFPEYISTIIRMYKHVYGFVVVHKTNVYINSIKISFPVLVTILPN